MQRSQVAGRCQQDWKEGRGPRSKVMLKVMKLQPKAWKTSQTWVSPQIYEGDSVLSTATNCSMGEPRIANA